MFLAKLARAEAEDDGHENKRYRPLLFRREDEDLPSCFLRLHRFRFGRT